MAGCSTPSARNCCPMRRSPLSKSIRSRASSAQSRLQPRSRRIRPPPLRVRPGGSAAPPPAGKQKRSPTRPRPSRIRRRESPRGRWRQRPPDPSAPKGPAEGRRVMRTHSAATRKRRPSRPHNEGTGLFLKRSAPPGLVARPQPPRNLKSHRGASPGPAFRISRGSRASSRSTTATSCWRPRKVLSWSISMRCTSGFSTVRSWRKSGWGRWSPSTC